MTLVITALLKTSGLPHKRRVKEHVRIALRKVAETWHEDMLPRHFDEDARGRYNYRERSEVYRKRKQRMAQFGRAMKGGRVDLVFSGLLEQSAETMATIRAFPLRAVVKMPTPAYARFHGKLFEITRTTVGEESKLNRIAEDSISTGFRRDQTLGTR